MRIDDPTSLIPKHKSDLETARAALEAGYPEVDPILGELLSWIQDINWPVAGILLPFLVSIGKPLSPHIAAALSGDDPMWKYWIISCVIEACPDLANVFRDEMLRLANSPSAAEIEDELNQVARDVVLKYGWENQP